jgi:alkylation response protein AidB-like acyl-CoA dehydrogenase
MRGIQWTVAGLAAAVVVGAGGSARAAEVEVKVPFPFVVHGKTLPAGEYRLENEGDVILIRGERGNKVGMFVMGMPAGGHDPAGEQPALTFKRDETTYRLTGVWESGSEGEEIRR